MKANDQGKRIKPEIQDIILILDNQDANRIFKRLNHKIEDDPKFKFQNNLIYLDYNFRSATGCYSFRKYAGPTKEFRDTSLPKKLRIEKTLGQDCDSLLITPEQFMEYKAIKVLM